MFSYASETVKLQLHLLFLMHHMKRPLAQGQYRATQKQ